jgi:hypothetical protein
MQTSGNHIRNNEDITEAVEAEGGGGEGGTHGVSLIDWFLA